MLQILKIPLEKVDLRKGLSSKKAGAFCCFEGLVRDHNEGKKVIALEYEAYESLCEREAKKIFREAFEQFNVIEARCYHREGKLNVGEMAVWVGVIAKHRDDGFKACRYIIDEVKKRLPIWKKEYYDNGDSEWVACNTCVSRSQHARSK